MKILSIETSCDETGISILEAKGGKGNKQNPSFSILADSLASQVEIHKEYGGVYPMLAKREHIKNLPILLEKTLREARIKSLQGRTLGIKKGPTLSRFEEKPVDLIAVTSGPGLEPALWTGIVFAKELAKKWGVPLIPVNHMEGHIFSVFANGKKFTIPKTKFPILSLLVSGGHTELVLMKNWNKYKVIGETLDDAAGEAFDKVARMLGLPYPGGPEISKLAKQERKSPQGQTLRMQKGLTFSRLPEISLPRPMLYSKNFDFSFSGLKTAVLYLIKKIEPLDEKKKMAIALEFENAVVETLIYKTKKAVEKYKIKTLVVAGGVSANRYLKKEIKRSLGKEIQVLFPTKKLATDNSIMIGIAGYMQYMKKKKKVPNPIKIKAEGGLRL